MEKIIKTFCNNCLNKTDHIKLFSKLTRDEEPYDTEYRISWSNNYELFECCGCHEIHLINTFWFSEWNPGETVINIYPPRISRKLPKWINDIPEDQKALLREIYFALSANSKRLVVMGTRALLDLFINDKIGDIGGFDQKLNELTEKGLISENQKNILSTFLDTGHAVIHRGFYPDDEIVNQVLDIIENILANYSLDKYKNELDAIVPKRKKEKPPKSI